MKEKNNPINIQNRKARFDYEILDTLEAGVVLTGDEIKAIRSKRVSMTGSYAKIIAGEVFWVGGIINMLKGDTQRTRKLLLHTEQIRKLAGKVQTEGQTLVPLELYIKKGRAKILLGLGKGRKKYDKRELIKKRDNERETTRLVK